MDRFSTPLRRKFGDRQELVEYLRQEFADVISDSTVSPLPGGRRAALELLHKIDPKAYARTRNHLDGKVSGLSPYLRHGVLTLAEVRDYALTRVSRPEEAEKFINELGWREYWQRLYRLLGKQIWRNGEAYKTGHAADSYAAQLPSDLEQAESGLSCMDGFARQLRETGYLHNHARMWLAAYLVHWRKVRWQAGAQWFLRHLLDGDPASNNLSWQWVASTFSHKPYFFNRENLERFSNGRFCANCRLRQACPLEGSYEQLEQRLFPPGRGSSGSPLHLRAAPHKPGPSAGPELSLFWMHGDGLRQASQAPALFVFDPFVLRRYRISLKRLVFMYECLLELEVEIERGNVMQHLQRRLSQGGFAQVLTTDSPSPGFARLRQQLEGQVKVALIEEPAFLQEPQAGLDLTRFSRFWQKVQSSAMQASGSGQR
ncbi:deoxyribodipyrimidine photolyase [bacterium]|nr:deoxyribodipyrimidine photolyase [bacterium]